VYRSEGYIRRALEVTENEKEADETYAASPVTPFKAFCDVHYLEL
jgi:hypothetical protein